MKRTVCRSSAECFASQRVKTFAFLFFILTPSLLSAEEILRDLDKIEAALKAAPDDPMLHYDKCRALFAKGKEQEAVDHASVALAKFKAAKDDLTWMGLGSFTTDRYRIDAHYNMGPKERAEKKDGIVRPYSFRVWTKETKPKIVRIIDFELAYTDGRLGTAAIGEMTREGHINFGIVDTNSDFAAIKTKVLAIVAK